MGGYSDGRYSNGFSVGNGNSKLEGCLIVESLVEELGSPWGGSSEGMSLLNASVVVVSAAAAHYAASI